MFCEYFGYAEGYDAERKRYLRLCTTTLHGPAVIGERVLIKPDIATRCQQQYQGETVAKAGTVSFMPQAAQTEEQKEKKEEGVSVAQVLKKTRFYGAIDLPPQKVTSSVQKIVDEVIQHLTSKFGINVTVTLNIQATSNDGFDEATVRLISENAKTLGFDRANTGFE